MNSTAGRNIARITRRFVNGESLIDLAGTLGVTCRAVGDRIATAMDRIRERLAG